MRRLNLVPRRVRAVALAAAALALPATVKAQQVMTAPGVTYAYPQYYQAPRYDRPPAYTAPVAPAGGYYYPVARQGRRWYGGNNAYSQHWPTGRNVPLAKPWLGR